MLRSNRPVDNNFRFFHQLYHRCTKEDIVGDRLVPLRIRYRNPSVNWSKYGKPWDVIFDFPGHGIAQFFVCGLPTELPRTAGVQKAKPHSFFPSHIPEYSNYSHCEIWTFKVGVHIPNPTLTDTVKKEFRQIMSDRAAILRSPLL
jgi:hypothetical protein